MTARIYPVSRVSSAPAVVKRLDWYAEKTLVHCGVSINVLSETNDTIQAIDLYPNGSTDVADMSIREAKNQRNAIVKAGSYFQTIREYERRKHCEDDEFNKILLKLNSIPKTSRVWLYAGPLQKALENVNQKLDSLEEESTRHRLSAAMKDALKEASFLEKVAKIIRNSEERETFYKNEASARSQELENLKTTVKTLSGQLKHALDASIEVQQTLKKARACARNVS